MKVASLFVFIAVLSLIINLQISALPVAKAAIGLASLNASTTLYYVTYKNNTYLCSVQSNSTVSNFAFIQQPLKEITLNVTGVNGSKGICNLIFPKQLLEPPYIIYLNGLHAYPTLATSSENGTHAFINYTYTHSSSSHKIEVIEANSIPEFPTYISSILFLSVLTLIPFLTKRKFYPS